MIDLLEQFIRTISYLEKELSIITQIKKLIQFAKKIFFIQI
jgi:hypothetical protein